MTSVSRKVLDYWLTLAYKPVDDQLRQEKETTEDTQIGLKDVLFHRRQEAFAIVRQLEREKGAYHLESIVSLCLKLISMIVNHFQHATHSLIDCS